MTDPRIYDKIRKLLALAQDPAAAPNEAITASRQAAALMAKHDLDMADLDDRQLELEWDLTEQSMTGCRPGKKNPSAVPPWISIMAYGVKLYTRTRCVRTDPYLRFRGPRQDVELAMWMLKALIDLAYAQSRGQDSPNAFRNSFAAAVQARLKAMARDREQATKEAGSTALVVVDKLQAAMDQLFGEEAEAGKSRFHSSAEGYAAGQRANIPTDRPINGPKRALLGSQ